MKSLNVGILGHVDSGKTTLTKYIAECFSTAALDKHADNGGRKNTLDLGFSSMCVDGKRLVLIDCPGHASLVRAVLSASTVFDMAIVVIDASNGLQAQTAEHLLLCSIVCPTRVIVVLNKIDLINVENIEKVRSTTRKGLKSLNFNECPIIDMSLQDGHFRQEMIENLKRAIESQVFDPDRQIDKPLLIAADHCFSIKGKGTVVTGTVTHGVLRTSQEIEFPSLKIIKKVKSLESWKTSTNEVSAGERVAMIVPNFDDSKFSRSIIGEPGLLVSVRQCIVTVNPIKFFRSSIKSNTKIHVSIAFETVMAECHFYREIGDEYEMLSTMEAPCVCHLIFERPIYVVENSPMFLMASRLDQNGKGCRFAFSGNIKKVLAEDESVKKFSRKFKTGIVERVEKDSCSAICTGTFKPETKMSIFENMQVVTESGVIGRIESSFGKGGKYRVIFEKRVVEKEKLNLYMKKYCGNKIVIMLVLNSSSSQLISRFCLLTSNRHLATSFRFYKEKQEELGDDGLPKDYKRKVLKIGSRRLDTFVSRSSGQSSSEVNKLILQGKVRVNDQVYTKKAYNVCQADIVEVWIKPYSDNTALANVERTEIVGYEVTANGYDFDVKQWKQFLSDNWRSSQ